MSEFVTSAVLWLAPAPPTRNPSGEARGAEQLKARAADHAGMTIAGATARPACHAVSGWPARAAAGVGLAWSRNDSQAPDVLNSVADRGSPHPRSGCLAGARVEGPSASVLPGCRPKPWGWTVGTGLSNTGLPAAAAAGLGPGGSSTDRRAPLLGWGAACKAAPDRQPNPEGTIRATQGPRAARSPGRPGRARRRPPRPRPAPRRPPGRRRGPGRRPRHRPRPTTPTHPRPLLPARRAPRDHGRARDRGSRAATADWWARARGGRTGRGGAAAGGRRGGRAATGAWRPAGGDQPAARLDSDRREFARRPGLRGLVPLGAVAGVPARRRGRRGAGRRAAVGAAPAVRPAGRRRGRRPRADRDGGWRAWTGWRRLAGPRRCSRVPGPAGRPRRGHARPASAAPGGQPAPAAAGVDGDRLGPGRRRRGGPPRRHAGQLSGGHHDLVTTPVS